MKIILENASEKKEEWLKIKQKKIGASQAYDAADIDEKSNPLRVALELLGRGEEFYDNERMYYGRQLENFVGEEFCRQYINDHPGAEVKLERPDVLVQHPTLEWAVCTPDFLPIINGEVVNLQTKTTQARYLPDWSDGNLPNRVRTQVLHEMGCLPQVYRSFAAAFIYEPTFRYVEVPREDGVIAELFAREQKFYDAVTSGNLPEMKIPNQSQLKELFWDTDGSSILLPEESEALLAEMHAMGQIEDAAKSKKKALSAKLLALCGKAKKAEVNGWRVTVVRTEYDELSTKDLKAKDRTLYDALVEEHKNHISFMYPRVTAPDGYAIELGPMLGSEDAKRIES